MHSPISRLNQTIALATWASEWLYALAEARGVSVVALCRELRTAGQLHKEAARQIVRDGQADAEYMVRERERLPAPTLPTPESSLRARVCFAYYERLIDAIQEREDEEADRALSARASKKAIL